MKGRWAIIPLLLLALGCGEAPPRQVAPAFYHWQTKLQLKGPERSYLDSLQVHKLYVKFFDVDWDEATAQPLPLAALEADTNGLAGLELVPTIFLTNRSLLHMAPAEIDGLAARIFDKITRLMPAGCPPLREVQFDCDWTLQTRDRFFALIDSFRKTALAAQKNPAPAAQLRISATIRLHQYKYFEKTGVPPVDRGMLMCYNMGDVENWETDNSILDLAATGQYLSPGRTSSYPLPLDIALPLFHWGVVYRDEKLVKLMHGLGEGELQGGPFAKLGPRRYQVERNTYLQGFYLYEGDLIRLETADLAELRKAGPLLASAAARQGFTLAFYHLDTSTLRQYPAADLERVMEEWRGF